MKFHDFHQKGDDSWQYPFGPPRNDIFNADYWFYYAKKGSWSNGKFAQAAASGIIIGWVYYRYGLISAILIHWATNYFIFSYVFVISEVNGISVTTAISHSMINTLEIILVLTGIISIAVIVMNFINSKNEDSITNKS